MSDPRDERDVSTMLDVAVELAEAAAPIALRYFRAPLDVQNKLSGNAFDPVTRADREVEAFIRDELTRRFPGHGIVGEEHGSVSGSGDWEWVIDPIDGTRSFISGSPAWGTLIGLMHRQRPVAGVVHVPYLRETFYGGPDGAWMRRDGERRALRTRGTESVADAILYCTHPATLAGDGVRRAFDRVAARCRMLRYGGDCYSYCMLAHGQLDLIVEGSLQPYDIIPIIPILAAAGGVITDVHGGNAQHGGMIVAAANATLHERAMQLIRANRETSSD
jgi:myo-inositol-1(or 4)-monophosphatase